MENLTWVDVFSAVSSTVSFILSILAMVFGFWVYTKTRDAERDTTGALAEIKTQTNSLEEITAKWIGMLIRRATTEKPHAADQTIVELSKTFSQIPQIIIQSITQLKPQGGKISMSSEELDNYFIIIYYYSAQTNYWAQWHLPKYFDFDITNSSHNLVKRIVDGSHKDFWICDEYLSGLDQSALDRHGNAAIYNETKNGLRSRVKTSDEIFGAQKEQPSQE